MGVLGVVVVTRPVKVGGHYTAVVNAMAFAVLAVVAFTKLNACNFGNGVGLVGRLQRAG